jgi:hypothetical protein
LIEYPNGSYLDLAGKNKRLLPDPMQDILAAAELVGGKRCAYGVDRESDVSGLRGIFPINVFQSDLLAWGDQREMLCQTNGRFFNGHAADRITLDVYAGKDAVLICDVKRRYGQKKEEHENGCANNESFETLKQITGKGS